MVGVGGTGDLYQNSCSGACTSTSQWTGYAEIPTGQTAIGDPALALFGGTLRLYFDNSTGQTYEGSLTSAAQWVGLGSFTSDPVAVLSTNGTTGLLGVGVPNAGYVDTLTNGTWGAKFFGQLGTMPPL